MGKLFVSLFVCRVGKVEIVVDRMTGWKILINLFLARITQFCNLEQKNWIAKIIISNTCAKRGKILFKLFMLSSYVSCYQSRYIYRIGYFYNILIVIWVCFLIWDTQRVFSSVVQPMSPIDVGTWQFKFHDKHTILNFTFLTIFNILDNICTKKV